MRRLASSLTALAAAGLLASGCSEQSAAIQVGDTSISRSELMDAAKGWASYLEVQSGGQEDVSGDRQDSFRQDFMGRIITQEVINTVAAQIFEDEGLDLSQADIDSQRAQLQQDPGLAEVSDEFLDELARNQAMQGLLQSTMGAELDAEIEERLGTTDISVDPRYGTWDTSWGLADAQAGTMAVQAPEGPLVQTGGDGTGTDLGELGGQIGDPSAPAG